MSQNVSLVLPGPPLPSSGKVTALTLELPSEYGYSIRLKCQLGLADRSLNVNAVAAQLLDWTDFDWRSRNRMFTAYGDAELIGTRRNADVKDLEKYVQCLK